MKGEPHHCERTNRLLGWTMVSFIVGTYLAYTSKMRGVIMGMAGLSWVQNLTSVYD